MPEILPDHVPSPRTPLVWDGTRYRAVRGHTDGTVQVRGEDQLFSIEQVVATRTIHVMVGGLNRADTPPVGAGRYWVITTVCARDDTTALTGIEIRNRHDATDVVIGQEVRAFAIAEPLCWSGMTVLDVDDFIRVVFAGAINGDTFYIDISGYQMTVE